MVSLTLPMKSAETFIDSRDDEIYEAWPDLLRTPSDLQP